MDDKIIHLKKRTKADMVCSLIIAVIAICVAVLQFVTYVSTEGTNVAYLTNGIYALFAFGVTLILFLMLLEVHKNGKPFSKRIINELSVLAVFVIIGGIIPNALTTVIHNEIYRLDSQIDIEMVLCAKNVIISLIGVVIGIVSEIFIYGYELQDDMDLIA